MGLKILLVQLLQGQFNIS